jgi:hypothetical protein
MGYISVADTSLKQKFLEVRAQFSHSMARRDYSPLEFVLLFLGPWVETHLLGPMNMQLENLQKHKSHDQSKNYHKASALEILKFLISRQLSGLIKYQKHTLSVAKLTSVTHNLIGQNRHDALSPALTFGHEQLREIFSHVPTLMREWVHLGTLCSIDESVFAYYGRRAFELGMLQNIPSKPHPFGLVTYLMCQRLLWTNLPIMIDLCPLWLGDPPTPVIAARLMLDRNQIPGQHQHLITDNLWSAPANFEYYNREGLLYSLSVKPSGDVVPEYLLQLAGTDLPTRHARTYARGDQIIQLLDCGNHNTTVISNAWSVNDARPAIREIRGTYKTALGFLQNESAATLVNMFGLDASWMVKPAADIIFHITGWDVLRPENQQGVPTQFTWELCNGMNRQQVLNIYKQRHKQARVPKNTTKARLMQLLFPDHVEGPSPPKAAKRKHQVKELVTLRTELRGASTSSHSVYDRWHGDNTDIDRMDQDYAMFYCTSGHFCAEKQGLESVIFFLMMSARALWEEHHSQVLFDRSGGNRGVVPFAPVYSIPEFIFAVGTALQSE